MLRYWQELFCKYDILGNSSKRWNLQDDDIKKQTISKDNYQILNLVFRISQEKNKNIMYNIYNSVKNKHK